MVLCLGGLADLPSGKCLRCETDPVVFLPRGYHCHAKEGLFSYEVVRYVRIESVGSGLV